MCIRDRFKNNHSEAQLILAEKILQIDPNLALDFLDKENPSHFMTLSQCFTELSNFPEALSYVNKFIDYNPRDIKGFLGGGWISIEMQAYDDAANFFDMALGVNAMSPEAIYGKGLVLKEKGESYESYQTILTQIDKELVI